jgi:predicted dehydrogenase
MGLGLLGLLAVQILKASGVRVIGADPNVQRCQLATELGADMVVSNNLEAACNDFSEGYGVDAVLITAATKSNEPVTVAGEICRIKGKVVVTGLVGMDIPRDMYYKKELDFKLSLSYGPGRYDPQYEEGGHDYPFGFVRWTEQRNMKAFLDLVAAGAVSPSKMITHRFDIDDALDAYDLIMGKSGDQYLGIVLNYGAADERRLTQIKKEERILYLKNRNAFPIQHHASLINIGFIGAGNFTKAVLFPALKKQADVSLKGICTANGMNAKQTAQKEGFAYSTTDYQQLLNDADISTVFVATRHDSHANFVTAALEAGKHVFVEKPLCLTIEELDGIEKVYFSLFNTHSSPPLVMTGFNRRFSPHAELIKKYFKDRRTPMMVNYRVNAGNIPPGMWVQDPAVGGGRIIGEACHFIDFASYLIGSAPVEVQATCVETANASLVAEDNVTIAIKYADGSVAQILYVAVGSAELAKEYCEIYADESVAVMDNFCSTVCTGKRGKQKLKGKQAKGFDEEISAFLGAVRKGTPAPISFQSIMETTACTFAIIKALKGKKAIRLDEFYPGNSVQQD